ncbi:unnamed protein product [Trichogramma brassicae]|uniref:Thioredoxin domain-containing protein 17 n=2 Tax=Trichogramma TaxID=7490 RepID=A0A6H5HWH0_9HYME|nr:thioredoxin domain-containing protein 17-like [Trichogramma pretiosum]CAB0027894.1 unnamed protein product [Trichogramma brassicae]
MVVRHYIEGYENFLEFIENWDSNKPTFVLFTGSKLESGESWCPDCVVAKPHIERGFDAAPDNFHYVVVEVGNRSFWKDPKCPFRSNPKTQLKVLPTLVRWGTQKRLEGDHLLNPSLISLLLNDED